METTFITIHDLSRDARILYCSDSIVDILGHIPDEVVNKSCWEFFHPNEIPIARQVHSRGVRLDKAAVLSYCQIKNREGQWVGCECCFTVVYDVMVCCTSVYRRGMSSQKRAVEAPIVRRLFSSSPKDPRYHMLAHLSSKFKTDPQPQAHEPRAALFLNRFTRTLAIMYATQGIEQVIGIPGEEMKGKSFYYMIQENCLQDAVRCLETAKVNNSIAYLRFWFRDPRQDDVGEPLSESETEADETMTDITESEDDESGGVRLEGRSGSGSGTGGTSSSGRQNTSTGTYSIQSHSASGNDTGARSSNQGARNSPLPPHPREGQAAFRDPLASTPASPGASSDRQEGIELEAVVSCTSDGLVVILRRARPAMPQQPPSQQSYANGLFAAPWAPEPIFPQRMLVPHYAWGGLPVPNHQMGPSVPNYGQNRTTGPNPADFMQSIREVAVFAWALVGINGRLAEFSRGKALGESQPPDGFPVWSPDHRDNVTGSGPGSGSGSVNPYSLSPMGRDPFGDPGVSNSSSSSTGGARFS